jgi:hypothetical protein
MRASIEVALFLSAAGIIFPVNYLTTVLPLYKHNFNGPQG